MRSKGIIASWNDDKGFGFITPNDGSSRIFIHIKAFANRNRRPAVNDVVSYDVARDKDGRTRAANAILSGDELARKPNRKSGAASILFALSFLTVLGISAHEASLSMLVLIAYASMSVVTFIAYAIDKSAAKNGRWRTGEGTLHLFALACGWPGALIAQQTLRHKSKKASFRFGLWVTILLNCAAFVWLHTNEGQFFLDQLLR